MNQVVFESRYVTLTLTMRPPKHTKVGDSVIFDAGRLIEFRDGKYATSDPEEIEFIRKHRFFGSQIVESTPNQPLEGKKVSAFACNYPGCNYVAIGETDAEAVRKLNGHKTKKGHWITETTADGQTTEGGDVPEEDEE